MKGRVSKEGKYRDEGGKGYLGKGVGYEPGGGYSVWKRVPTVDRVPRSCGCRGQTMQKKGGCPVIIDGYRELSNMFILGFYIRLQLYAFKVVQETLQNR